MALPPDPRGLSLWFPGGQHAAAQEKATRYFSPPSHKSGDALGSCLHVALSSSPAKRRHYITARRGRTTTKQILYLTWGTLQYFPKYKVAVFVHGCFWHRHLDCKYSYMPKTNHDFWTTKFNVNRRRDAEVSSSLEEHGIRVLVIWECTLRKMKADDNFRLAVVMDIVKYVRNLTLNTSSNFLYHYEI